MANMTSEFWVTIVVVAIMGVLGVMDKLTPELVAALAGPTGVYALSRSIAKHGNRDV